MSQPTPSPTLRRTLVGIRKRALLYAEYHAFSRFIQTEEPICALTKEEWQNSVREIEIEIMKEEHPYLIPMNIQNYTPMGVFFSEAYHNVIRIERA